MIGLIALAGLARSQAKPIEAKRDYDLKLGYQTALGKMQSAQELETAEETFKLTKDLEYEYFMSPEGTLQREIEQKETLDLKEKELALQTADWIDREMWNYTEAVNLEIGKKNRITIGTKGVNLTAKLEEMRELNTLKLEYEVELLQNRTQSEIDAYIEKQLRSIREVDSVKVQAEVRRLRNLAPVQLGLELRRLKQISTQEHRMYLKHLEPKSAAERQEWLKDKLIEYHPQITQKEIQTQLNIMNKLKPREIALKLAELKALAPETLRQFAAKEEIKAQFENQSTFMTKPSDTVKVVVGDGDDRTEKEVLLYNPRHQYFQDSKKETDIVNNGLEYLHGLMRDNSIDAIFES